MTVLDDLKQGIDKFAHDAPLLISAIRRETIEECKSIVSDAITGLEDGPYGKDIEDVIAGVLESCKARISALKEE